MYVYSNVFNDVHTHMYMHTKQSWLKPDLDRSLFTSFNVQNSPVTLPAGPLLSGVVG